MGDSERNLTQWEKSENLKWAVLCRSPRKLERYYRKLGKVDFTATALGLACRCRGVEWVKVLVKLGAEFRYDPEELERSSGGGFRIGVNYAALMLKKTHFESYYNKPVISTAERLEVLEYLLETADRTGFDKDEMLFYAVLNCEFEIADRLGKAGAKIPQKITDALTEEKTDEWSYEKWIDFCVMTYHLSDEEYKECMSALISEIGGRKFRYGGWIRDGFKEREKIPGFYEFFFKNFNIPDDDIIAILRSVIKNGTVDGLSAAAENGLLKSFKDCEELIKYSTEKGKTDFTAFLLDHLNRNFDVAAERAKADEKLLNELFGE